MNPLTSRPDNHVDGRGEIGSGTMLTIVACALLMFIGLGLSGVAAIVLAHRSAQAAADLAALAGATAAADGGDACAAAGRIAIANTAEVTACRRVGLAVTVAVSVAGPRLLQRRYDVVAEARAGPAGWSG